MTGNRDHNLSWSGHVWKSKTDSFVSKKIVSCPFATSQLYLRDDATQHIGSSVLSLFVILRLKIVQYCDDTNNVLRIVNMGYPSVMKEIKFKNCGCGQTIHHAYKPRPHQVVNTRPRMNVPYYLVCVCVFSLLSSALAE